LAQNFQSRKVLLAAIIEQSEMIAEMMQNNQVNAAMAAAMWRDFLVVKLERNSDSGASDSGTKPFDGGSGEGY
jgi:hypothetical protein